ncbi:hypothetical protein LTR37_000092 [Vermiconidia calcicola]|uniref:Uncharacterized protein n=1 Tax=Vermiconidia calcicola TaxID=1690605 RepID=A0ACC3NZI0_9PEZI|nr:hypothetical protein LTR37_000092 [Vermiconidia calcicola]
MAKAKRFIFAEVRDGRTLVVFAKEGRGVGVMRDHLERLQTSDETKATTSPEAFVKHELNEDDQDGPNHRGTYSKAYVLQHPEIKWAHRGQGRYLPATAPRAVNSQSLSQPKAPHLNDSATRKSFDNLRSRSLRNSLPERRSSWAGEEDSKERVPALRKRLTDALTNSADSEERSARLGRRAKPAQTTETDRRSSRIQTQLNYNDQSDEDADMAGEKESTFDRDYVEAHPDEQFYHTGNGWYKRGTRPRGRKNAKQRDNEGHAVMRSRDGSFQFNKNTTIHVSQLDNYPGVEFHHCGNGWYRAGPDSSGHRASRFGGDVIEPTDDEEGEGVDEEDGEGEDEDEDEDEEEDIDGVVSKEYTRRHPEIEWAHRGKGRYMRKSAVNALKATTTASASLEPERDQQIYSKAFVEAHPDEEFHHRGNARYMRGPPPEHWPSVQRRKSSLAPPPPTQPDAGALFDKHYVSLHPELQFHHRGQGRYALGPRKSTSENGADGDAEGLYDTAWVEAHLNETFHHRGQGRWAKGMPPPGSSKKVAVRGPGAIERMDGSDEEGDETNKPPGLTALVLRTEADKWPQFDWKYRGGGKWGRITKLEFEEMQRGNAIRKPKGRGRMSRIGGPEAQLERESAAAAATQRLADDDGFQVAGEMGADGMSRLEVPPPKRRRKRGTFHPKEDGTGTKQSSISHSQVPTPKPRMLEPEEDILTEEDLPQLYRDEWSPATEDFDRPVHKQLNFRPINPPEKFVRALTKHEPASRPLENLKILANNTQAALDKIQAEYLRLDKITAPHARIPRKPAKGGRVPIDPQIFEDKKEADLYDYHFDPRRLGYQDPDTQKVQRDAEGRELRNRRHRSGATNGTLPGWNFGEDELLGPRRAVKPVNRFDGTVEAPRKRVRNSGVTSKAPSMTPDRGATPLGGSMRSGLGTLTTGRLLGGSSTVPKRIRELRDESVGVGSVGREGSPNGSSARKGRPPGSKNLHKRRDAGIKKGPRKAKIVESIEGAVESDDGEGEVEGELV